MNPIDIFNWGVVLTNILGVKWVAENTQLSAKRANQLWSITNPLIIFYNIYHQTYPLAFMFTIYWIYAIAGAFDKPDPFVTILKKLTRRT